MKSDFFWEKAQNALKLEARERLKTLKQIGYEVSETIKSSKDLSVGELKTYISILRIVVRVPAISPSFNTLLAKVTNKYLAAIGCENPQILIKKSTKIDLISGLIAIGDPFYAPDPGKEEVDINLINSGKSYIFNAESYGLVNVQVRVVDAPEPALSSKEYKKVMAASPVVILNFPSGKFAIDDGSIDKAPPPSVVIDIAPGNYKCQAYLFSLPSDNFSYYIVLSKTEEKAVNNEREIITLEPNS